MKEILNRKYLLVVLIAVILIIVAAALSVSIYEKQHYPAGSGSVLHAVDVFPENSDFGEDVELRYGHIEDWESIMYSMDSPLLPCTAPSC